MNEEIIKKMPEWVRLLLAWYKTTTDKNENTTTE